MKSVLGLSSPDHQWEHFCSSPRNQWGGIYLLEFSMSISGMKCWDPIWKELLTCVITLVWLHFSFVIHHCHHDHYYFYRARPLKPTLGKMWWAVLWVYILKVVLLHENICDGGPKGKQNCVRTYNQPPFSGRGLQFPKLPLSFFLDFTLHSFFNQILYNKILHHELY